MIAPVGSQALAERLASAGVTTYVEVGRGPVLSGLGGKTHRGGIGITFGSPDVLMAVESAIKT